MVTTILRLTVTVPLMSHRHGFPAQSRVSGMLVFPVPGVPLCVALPLCLQASHAHFSLQGVSGLGATPTPLPRGERPMLLPCTHNHTGHTGSGWVKLTPRSGLQSPLVLLPESLCFSSSQESANAISPSPHAHTHSTRTHAHVEHTYRIL